MTKSSISDIGRFMNTPLVIVILKNHKKYWRKHWKHSPEQSILRDFTYFWQASHNGWLHSECMNYFVVDFAYSDQTWKNQSSQNVGDLTITKILTLIIKIQFFNWFKFCAKFYCSHFIAAVSNNLNSFWLPSLNFSFFSCS